MKDDDDVMRGDLTARGIARLHMYDERCACCGARPRAQRHVELPPWSELAIVQVCGSLYCRDRAERGAVTPQRWWNRAARLHGMRMFNVDGSVRPTEEWWR